MLKRCEDTNLSLNWEKSHFMVKEGIVLGHKISKSGIEVDHAKVEVIAKLPHPLLSKILLLQEFDVEIRDKKGAENLAADHLSRLENPHQNDTPWFADFGNYHAGNFIVKGMSSQQKNKFFKDVKHDFWDDPFLFKICTDQVIRRCVSRQEAFDILKAATFGTHRDTTVPITPLKRSSIQDFIGPRSTRMPMTLSPDVTFVNFKAKFLQRDKMPKTHPSLRTPITLWGLIYGGRFPSSRGNKYILVEVNYLSKWVEAKALPTNDARVVCKFLKTLFSRFGAPRAIISDRGTHFCNDQFSKVMLKYGVTHRLSTAYHPQTSGQVEVSNRGLKRILERTIGKNRASWSDKLDDALWAFQHKAYWALKHTNFDIKTTGDHRKVQLNELNELRDHAYENSLIYKEKTKRIHDSKIKNRVFNVGDRVLLFNSRLKIFSGKLKTRWSGPFTVTQVFPYGTVELSQNSEPNFKVNGHRLKHYFGGDIPTKDLPDCEDSRARSFILHPQEFHILRKRVEDLQLGIESYQIKLNLEQPNSDASDFPFKEDYTIFNDGTLTRIKEKLDFMVKDFKLFKFNTGMENRKWTEDDKRRSEYFIEVIERRLKIRRIFRSLESFVGGRHK
ncbi:reverse transcriptase domain-containing protein [Tanacetum coccineum]